MAFVGKINDKSKVLRGCYGKDLYSWTAMFTTLKVYGGDELEIDDDALKEIEEKKLLEFEALLDKIPDAGFGFVAYSFRDGDPYDKEPEYFWLANASEIKEFWYDQGLGELLEAGVGFGMSRNVDCRYDDSDVGDLQFVLRGRDGREVLTTVRRLLGEYNRTGDWYFNAIVSSASVGNDANEIFKKYDAHNLPE
ncbi:MAG: hypothetical protein J6K20_00050 [Thermoguttaceae bacterium]|nr:hypothetical protein [Thermoguttaceae bacterium]